ELEIDFRAVERLREGKAHDSLVVAAGHWIIRSPCAGASLASAKAGEQALEIDVLEAALTLGKLLVPVGRRPELLAGLVAAQLVVSGPLLGILERFVGFGHFLEL